MATLSSPGVVTALVALAGVAAGWINTLAGGGSLVALPALVLLAGLPDTDANGTLRVAILVQTAVACWRYRRAGALDLKAAAPLAAPAVVGALAGAWLATEVGDAALRRALVAVLLLATGSLLLPMGEPKSKPRRPVWTALALFGAGLYGGFVQAGVGFLLLLALTRVAGHRLVQANVLKVAVVLAYTPFALATFVARGHVDLALGLALALGQATGAWWAAGAALSPRGVRITRVTLAVVVVALAVKMALS